MSNPARLVTTAFSDALTRTPAEPSWQWAAGSVNYSRAPNYDTPYRDWFDPDLMPFWREPLDLLQHQDHREIDILKCSRAGYSENVVLTDLRYTIARNPEPTFYITGKMDLCTGFLDRRVIRGMSMSEETARAFRHAKAVKQDIQFPAMDFRATWCTSDTATKQDGWARIYCDELSLWAEMTVDMVRERAAAYPFHHIVFGGSIDPKRKGNPEEDPMLKRYLESDQRLWFMPDPGGGTFHFAHSGIRWPADAKREDDTWDLERVRAESWYETPTGSRIEEADRADVMREGAWVPTSATGIRPGFKVVSPMVPFESKSFGELAVKFLSANSRLNTVGRREDRVHNTIRVYFAEHWAEVRRDEETKVEDETLSVCEGDYDYGQVWVPEKKLTSGVFVTVDVQKTHLWWLARTWAWNQEANRAYSSLLGFGNAPGFTDLDATIGEFSPAMVGIDIGYALRQSEVADYCAEYVDESDPKESRVMALRGNDKMEKATIEWHVRDAMEGRSTQTGVQPYLELTWAADTFRTWLVESMTSESDWYVPQTWADDRLRRQYLRQVTSTRKVDGEWVAAHRDDHGFDLEVMQYVLARWDSMV